MARYTGPKTKIARRYGEPIMGPSKALAKKITLPECTERVVGQRSRSTLCNWLRNKSKFIYGILERQFRSLFEKAAVKAGLTGENLLRYCEARLDNTVYRLGIAPTRRAARQLVSHKHILVDGEIVNIPSYSLRPGQIVTVREKSKSLEAVTDSLAGHSAKGFNWLEWDAQQLSGKFITFPDRESIPENINEQLIVELYSK